MKTCKKCQHPRPETDFYLISSRNHRRAVCRFCQSAKAAQVDRDGTRPEKLAATKRQKDVVRYGIAVVEALDDMHEYEYNEDIRHLIDIGYSE